MSSLLIKHEPEQHRFVCALDNEQAVLSYQLADDTVNFSHTYTPPAFRGRGVSTQLVQVGLAWAKEQQLAIHANCSFVQKFLQ